MKNSSEPRRLELSFPSQLGYEVIAREAVASFARQIGLDRERVDDVKTALGEACINAIEHGNQLRAELTIDIVCSYDGQQLLVEVHDQGVQNFVPGSAPLSIEEKIAGLGPLRGMGLLLMTQLADEASFLAETEGGNCFRLAWYQPSPTSDSQPGPPLNRENEANSG
jgi:serine/threonine-protein kinase RsbW